jgi:hypothetical protein
MASRKVDIQISTRADTTGARQAETAMESLATASTQAGNAGQAAGKGVASVGTIATSAGYQVQDFAVQVAGGTSALVAMSQQAPQFLGVFGPGGAIAGALIAVGAIAAKVFMGMADDSASAAEKATLLADAVEQIGENAGKAIAKKVDFGLAKIAAAETAALKLVGAYNSVKDAANASALAGLANTEKLRELETNLAKLRGEQVDDFKEIAASAQAEATMRQAQAQQQIAAQVRLKEEAEQIEEAKRQAFLAAQSDLTQAELLRQEETRRLEVLRAQRDELEKQSRERTGFMESLAQGGIPFLKTPAAEAAEKQLADPAFQALLQSTEAKVNQLDAQLAENGGALAEAVIAAGIGLNDAVQNAVEVADAVAIEIPKIQESFNVQAVEGQFEELKASTDTAIEQIKSIIENVKPENSGQAQAIEALKVVVADNQIIGNESLKVSNSVQVLSGVINANMEKVNVNVASLISIMNDFNRRTTEQKRQLDELQSRIRSGN